MRWTIVSPGKGADWLRVGMNLYSGTRDPRRTTPPPCSFFARVPVGAARYIEEPSVPGEGLSRKIFVSQLVRPPRLMDITGRLGDVKAMLGLPEDAHYGQIAKALCDAEGRFKAQFDGWYVGTRPIAHILLFHPERFVEVVDELDPEEVWEGRHRRRARVRTRR